MPDELQNIHSSIISRQLKWHITKGILKRENVLNTYYRRGPGKPKKYDDSMANVSGPRLYYSKTEYMLALEKTIVELIPRAIIYSILHDSRIIERFLKLLIYKKLLKIKHTDAHVILKELKTMGPFHESDFNIDLYKQTHSELSRIKRKNLISIASEKANLLIQELDWRDRIYSKFFIAGGLFGYDGIY